MPRDDSNSSPDAPGSSLLAGLKAQQPDAWQRFLRLYGPLLYSWCRQRWQLPAQDSADVVQEIVVKVMQALPKFRGGNFVAWLAKVTRSQVVRHFQQTPTHAVGGSDLQKLLAEVTDHRAPPDLEAELPAADEETGPEALDGVLHRAVDRIRSRVTETSWQAFWQVTVQGRKPADVAGDLGLSANAVYIASSRVLYRLREELGDLEEN